MTKVSGLLQHNSVAWAHGNFLVNYMEIVEFIGLNGQIKLVASGLRTQFGMDIMELQMPGLVKLGTWNNLDKLNLARVEEEIIKEHFL